MRINVPFIKSRGFECGQACVAMMIKYFYPNFEPSFDEFNKVIHQMNDTYTFPPQLAILLDHYGVRTEVFSSDSINTSMEDFGQFRRWYGKDFKKQMKFIDISSFDFMVIKFRKKKLFRKKVTEFKELIKFFKKGLLVAIPIDWTTLSNKNGSYQGHFVIITGIEDKNIYIHDPDIGSFQKYTMSQLKKAWEHPAIADDYLIAYGKK